MLRFTVVKSMTFTTQLRVSKWVLRSSIISPISVEVQNSSCENVNKMTEQRDSLRCAGVLWIGGAFFARGKVAAAVLRDGHGQDVGWLLCPHLHNSCVSPTRLDARNAKAEGTVDVCLATFTEQSKLELLFILW